jgi:hypothetical protein
MKLSIQNFEEFLTEILSEREWNKDSNTPRDYDQEYNAPGSKEQDERNKRKRDKRKHDREHGECPEGEELHHVNGIENDEVKCEPVSDNRGRKEKSRLKKGEKEEPEDKGVILIKIEEQELRQIIQEETEEVLREILPALAGLAVRGVGAAAKSKVGQGLMKKAASSLAKGAAKKVAPKAKQMAKKIGGTEVGSFGNLEDMIDQVVSQASDEELKGDPNQLINKLRQSLPYLKQLKGGA